MPKPTAFSSHEAIKRSLRSKFKLILSENKILVDTINGYVKKAEKVYRDMEGANDVTPRQFAKAMEKLERTYSACVKLILVASDLFEKGDTIRMKTRDATASSCDSETSMFSSASSTTLNSNRTRKGLADKGSQRRSKSSDMRLNEVTRNKDRDRASSRVNSGTVEVSDQLAVQAMTASSERLFVRPGNCSEFDYLIELQRFLHGLEKEKLQSDHSNSRIPLGGKKLPASKSASKKAVSAKQMSENKKLLSPESPESLNQRLRVLQNAIDHFKDRNIENDRVTHALNDIKELVIQSADQFDKYGGQEEEDKGSLNSLNSPVSMSLSIEVRTELENKMSCTNRYGQSRGSNSFPISFDKHEKAILSKQSFMTEAASEAMKMLPANGEVPTEKKSSVVEKQQTLSQNKPKVKVEGQTRFKVEKNEQKLTGVPKQASIMYSAGQVGNDNEGINQVIVNKIVDIVSAKLAPHLQLKTDENRSSLQQPCSEGPAEPASTKETGKLQPGSRSPSRLTCQAISSRSIQQSNYCGNYSSFQQMYQLSPHQYDPQQIKDFQKTYQRHQRPKMVSFVEDCNIASQFPHWPKRYDTNPRQLEIDSSLSDIGGGSVYDVRESEKIQEFENEQSNRFTSPDKKRMYSIQQVVPSQRCCEKFLQQGCLPAMKKAQADDCNDGASVEAELEKDENESDLVDESDSDEEENLQQNQHHSTDLKSTQRQESDVWVDRAMNKMAQNFEGVEYCSIHHIQRGPQLHSISQNHHDSCIWHSTGESPKAETHKISLEERGDHEWYNSPHSPAESNLDKQHGPQSEGDGPIPPHGYIEDKTLEQLQADYQEEPAGSPSTNYKTSEGWNHRFPSPKSPLSYTHQPPEQARQCPIKVKRASSLVGQPHAQMNKFPSLTKKLSDFAKFKSHDEARQTATDTSTETSPGINMDDRILNENMAGGQDTQEGGETRSSCADVALADSKQLQGEASRTLTLSNLPLDLQESELLNVLKNYGHVTKIYYIKDRNTGRFQGRAFGKYSKSTEAYNAVHALNSLVIDGHEVSVQLYLHKA